MSRDAAPAPAAVAPAARADAPAAPAASEAPAGASARAAAPAGAAQARDWRTPLALGMVYALLAGLSLVISRQPGAVATAWLANAPVVVWLLLRPPRQWTAPLGAVALANLLANRAWGDDWVLAASFVPPNLLEIVLGAWLLRRAGLADSELRSAESMLKLWLFGALLPQLAAATLGALAVGQQSTLGFGALWLQWFQGSLIGELSMLPLSFVLLRQPPSAWWPALAQWRVMALLPASVGFTLLCLMHLPFPFVYLSAPLLLAAMVTELTAVAVLAAVVSLVVSVSLGFALFVPPPISADWQPLFVYLAHAAALVPPLLLGAALAELRDSHARLTQRGEALRRANEGLEQFVRIASHDLREPLNTIVQFSGLVEQDQAERLPPEARQYLGLVRSAASRMRSLLDDVLQYARLQGGDAEPPGPVSLDALMVDVQRAVAGRLRDSGGVLEVGPLPEVEGHAAMLSLLLQNLVSNALKFVPPGRAPRVRVAARVDGGTLELVVHDNGIGIREADQGRLFKPFQRLNLRRQYEGTGLGLALCRQVAQLHRGEITLRSTPGTGSAFTLRMPLRQD